MAAADFARFHAMHIGQIDQYTFIFPVQFLLNDLPEALRGKSGNDIVGGIIAGRFVFNWFLRSPRTGGPAESVSHRRPRYARTF